jgi:HlyD family secretion protein
MRRIRLNRRRIILGAAGLLVLMLIVRALLPAPLEVDTALAEPTALRVTLDEDGRTRAVDRYVVTAPIAGRLRRIELREGARVARGETLAIIEPLPLDASTRAQLEAQLAAAQARQAAAQAPLAQARSARDQAARELERRQRLLEEGAISAELVEQFALAVQAYTEDLRAAEQAARAAAAEVAAVRGALLSANATPGTGIPISAPGGGVVLRVPERSERIVAPGEPLIELGNPDALEAVVDVLSTEAVRVEPGMPVTLTGWGGPPLAATVRLVEPSAFTRISALGVEEQRVNVLLDLNMRPAELGEGYRVEASILVWAGDDVLTVPSAALFRAPGSVGVAATETPLPGALHEGVGWQLFAVVNGRARLRDVIVGERDATRTQILEGVRAGERVVVFPSDRLTDGARVRSR